jgi:O-antigen ligase
MSLFLFLLWSFVLIGRPQDILMQLQAFRPALLLSAPVILSVIGTKKNGGFDMLAQHKVGKLYIIFYLLILTQVPFAFHKRVAFEFATTVYLANILFFIAFVLIIDSLSKLESFFFLLCLTTLFYSIFTLHQGIVIQSRQVGFSQLYDPNDISFLLSSLMPINLYFIITKTTFLKKLISATSLCTSFVVIFLSGSRAGFIALALIVFLLVVTKTITLKTSYKFLIVLLLVLFSYKNIHNPVFERYSTLTKIETDYNVTSEFGRISLWKRSIKLALENPFTGVGVECFPIAVGYMREAENVQPRWQVSHNTYLQALSETGFPGFFLFLNLIGSSIRSILSTKAKSTKAKSTESKALQALSDMSSVLFVGFIAMLITAFFISQAYSILFPLFFAISISISNISEGTMSA